MTDLGPAGILYNNSKSKYIKFSRNLSRISPSALVGIINEKETLIDDLIKNKLMTEGDYEFFHKKSCSDKNRFNKTKSIYFYSKKYGSTNLNEKIDFGPLDYYSLKESKHLYKTTQQAMKDKLNRKIIIHSSNFNVKSSKIPFIISAEAAKNILKNLKKSLKENHNIKKKKSFDAFFHRNSLITKKNIKQNNSENNMRFNLFSNNQKYKHKSSLNVSEINENDTDKNYIIKSKDINQSSRQSTNSAICFDKKNETISNSIKTKTATNYYNSSNTIKNIISSYIQSSNICTKKVVNKLNSNKNILKNKKKLLLLNQDLSMFKNFKKYIELFQNDKKYTKTLDSNTNIDIKNNTKKNINNNNINSETEKKINTHILEKLLKINKSKEIRKKFCKFGTKTLTSLANSVDSNQKKLNNKLFKIIDKANKGVKKEKKIDKVLEVILDTKIKKNKKSTAKQEYWDAKGKKLLEDHNKLRRLMELGDIITNMTDNAALNFTGNILKINNKKKKNSHFHEINNEKIENVEQNGIELRNRVNIKQNKIEYKMRIREKEKNRLNEKINFVIAKNKLIEETEDELRKTQTPKKNNCSYFKTESNKKRKNHNNDGLFNLDFDKIFYNK